MSIQLLVTFTAKQEKLSAFSEIMDKVKVDLPNADGCEGVQILRSKSDPRVFTLVEVWGSEDLHQRHIKRFVDSGGWTHVLSHLATEPVTDYYDEI